MRTRKEGTVLCNICNKDMYDPIKDILFVGLHLETKQIPKTEWYKKQFGKYKPNKTYYLCWECLFKNYGLKP